MRRRIQRTRLPKGHKAPSMTWDLVRRIRAIPLMLFCRPQVKLLQPLTPSEASAEVTGRQGPPLHVLLNLESLGQRAPTTIHSLVCNAHVT